ncbi:hypothetical protein LTR56_007750 [Elasticomyces elasticus]|nr:hypothetical protein LTR56_007750 [Elasticomyces elasticus]KAK3661878.1 hypothetical protein LTR22_007252 [Elasticomyces elasticus]KAK4925609.1 hypothetical protein LTR49_007447 [Elasticomyces elasticus]KAK5748576.1 hypothetical protein LTS12_021350 [Elasticomyces elasticus]
MESSMMSPSQGLEPVNVAPDGDVYLVCGEPGVKIRVSSFILTRASTEFAAILHAHFTEGTSKPDSQSPADVPLLNDDYHAVRDLCNLLHGNTITGLLGPKAAGRIYKLAVMVDSYRCTKYLDLQGQALLLGYWDKYGQASLSLSNLSAMAAAAYLLNQARGFSIATHHMILSTSEHYSKVLKLDYGHISFQSTQFVCLALEEKRAAAQAKIAYGLPQLGMPVCSFYDDESEDDMGDRQNACDNWEGTYHRAMCKAFGVNFWPPSFQPSKDAPDADLTLCSAIECIRTIGDCRFEKPTCIHSGERKGVSSSKLRDFAKEVEKMCDGLCLGCVAEVTDAVKLKEKCLRHG